MQIELEGPSGPGQIAKRRSRRRPSARAVPGFQRAPAAAGLKPAWVVFGLCAIVGCSGASADHASPVPIAHPIANDTDAGGNDASGEGTTNPVAAGDVPATGQCNVSTQGGCPPNHTCVQAGSSGDTSCYGAGAIARGDTCFETFDCVAGDICLYSSCAAVCATNADCPFPGAQCIQATDANNAPIAGYEACSSQCNPADPSNQARSSSFGSCGAGQRCDNGDGQGTTVCVATTTAYAEGQSCMSDDDCASGLLCLLSQASSSAGSCTPFCLMGQGACSQGSCQSFATPAYVGSVEIGYCG